MIKIEVEMHAFAGGAIRTVTLPDGMEPTLGRVFEMGQNDFALDEDLAQGLPSVSVGDIIRLDGERHVVMPSGFKVVPKDFEPPHDGGFYAYKAEVKEASAMTYKDRHGRPLKLGDLVRVQHTTGPYGQTKIDQGRVTNFGQYGGLTLDGTRYVCVPREGYHRHVDFEHGHETWVEILKEG